MTQQQPQDDRNETAQQATQQNAQRAEGGQAQRSESLLPADDAADGRYDVAEEVNLDQQSDALRRVGKAPQGASSDALADSLKDDGAQD